MMSRLLPLLVAVLGVSGPALAASGSCCPSAGSEISSLPSTTKILLIGEMHGTNEGPEYAGNLVCSVLASGRSVILGIEQPSDEQAQIDDYLHDPQPNIGARILDGPFWTRSYQDGRSSKAMYALITRIASWAKDCPVAIAPFDIPAGTDRDYPGFQRDKYMADHFLSFHADERDNPLRVALVGNYHNRRTVATDPGPLQNMLSALPVEGTVAVRLTWDKGSAWICHSDGTCGAMELDEMPSGGVMPPKGRIMLNEGGGGRYDGNMFVGTLTASSPARD